MRIIASFRTDEPLELERQLMQMEQNIDDAIGTAQRASTAKFRPTNVKTAAYVAQLDELVLADTSAVSVTITLPVATPQNVGRCVAIARKSASNTLTVRPVSSLVNGAASLALTASVRLFVLVSDGAGWWSTL